MAGSELITFVRELPSLSKKRKDRLSGLPRLRCNRPVRIPRDRLNRGRLYNEIDHYIHDCMSFNSVLNTNYSEDDPTVAA